MERLEPLTAPNNVHTAIFVCKRPPDMFWNKGDRAKYIFLLISLRSIISPRIINSGMALSVKELSTFQTASTATKVIPPATK